MVSKARFLRAMLIALDPVFIIYRPPDFRKVCVSDRFFARCVVMSLEMRILRDVMFSHRDIIIISILAF